MHPLEDATVIAQGTTGLEAAQLEREGQRLADNGQLERALETLEAAAGQYRSQNDVVGEAIANSHIAQVMARLEDWEGANAAIANSVSVLEQVERATGAGSVLPQVLDVQGRLAFLQGELQASFDSWDRASTLFANNGDLDSSFRSRIHQAEALQSLGLYRRAILTLDSLVETLEDTPDSPTKAAGLRSYGDALLVAGDVVQARTTLADSLKVATALGDAEAIAMAQLSLGNLEREDNPEEALRQYRLAAAAPTQTGHSTQSIQLRAHLNELSLLVEIEDWLAAGDLWPEILAQLEELPANRTSTDSRINLARSLETLQQQAPHYAPASADIARMYAKARQDARQVEDLRTESIATGYLAHLYEVEGQVETASDLTQSALGLAQAARAADIAYRWHWQLGRLKTVTNQKTEAVTSYRAALDTLKGLRGDLVAMNAEVRYAFRDTIEPIHRQLVDLLMSEEILESQQTFNGDTPLEAARQVIESLQLAELDNFFRAACINSVPVQIDDIDDSAAILYPILLDDRIVTIVRFPDQEDLQLFDAPVAREEVERTVYRLRLAFGQRNSPRSRFQPLTESLYDWLVRPFEGELAASEVETLVFVPDGVLRNVPMGSLHTGDHYLIEDYAIALSPGLELLPPQLGQQPDGGILLAGLTESRQGFNALPFVSSEVDRIDSQYSSRRLLDGEFTTTALEDAVGDDPFPIVHLATHGQFTSSLDRTFLLTWDERLDINGLRSLVVARDFSRSRPIDLLVLSACETAMGDRHAALGLAGVATRAGARSTLATLWQVNDSATSVLMEQFYSNLKVEGITKAEALREAQLSILQDESGELEHPFYWAAFVMVGNWR